MPRERACPKGRRRVSEGRYRTTQEDCKRTELAVEISDDSNAPLRTMKLGAYPFTDNNFVREEWEMGVIGGIVRPAVP